MARTFTIIAALLGVLGIAAGTFGAHGLGPRLSSKDLDIWQTAAQYHMYHVLALLAVAWASERFRSRAVIASGWLLTVGIVIFAGSLYLLATSELVFGQRQSWLGAVTPAGGVCFIGGWLALLIGAIRSRGHAATR